MAIVGHGLHGGVVVSAKDLGAPQLIVGREEDGFYLFGGIHKSFGRLRLGVFLKNFEVFEDECNKVLESGVLGLVLDLSGMESLTSAGVGAIVNLSNILKSREGRLVVASPGPRIMNGFKLLGLTEVMTIVATADEARKIVASVK